MNHSTTAASIQMHYELRYVGIFNGGRGYAFPCDAHGLVDMDHLSDRVRTNYFYARAVVGSQLAFPTVQRALQRQAPLDDQADRDLWRIAGTNLREAPSRAEPPKVNERKRTFEDLLHARLQDIGVVVSSPTV